MSVSTPTKQPIQSELAVISNRLLKATTQEELHDIRRLQRMRWDEFTIERANRSLTLDQRRKIASLPNGTKQEMLKAQTWEDKRKIWKYLRTVYGEQAGTKYNEAFNQLSPEQQQRFKAIAKHKPEPQPKPELQPEAIDPRQYRQATERDLHIGVRVVTDHHRYERVPGKVVAIEPAGKGNQFNRYEVVLDGYGYDDGKMFRAIDLMIKDESLAIAPEPEDTNPAPANFNRELTDADYREDLLKAQCQQDINDLAEYLGEERFTRIWESLDNSTQTSLNALPEFDADE